MQHVKAGTAALITAIRPGNLECVWRPPGGAVRLALLVLAGWGLAGQQSSAAPVNDNFANRIVLSGTDIHRTGSNVGATTEPGEPAGNENTVWYSWTAPANGFATVQADFHKIALVTPTRLPTAVYTGSSLANLTLAPIQASNTFHSDYIFPTVAGRAYQIAVQTPTDQTDQFDFSLFTGPVALNDNFANSTLLVGAPAAVKAIVLNSSTEPGEPTPCYPGSLWWSWTDPRS